VKISIITLLLLGASYVTAETVVVVPSYVPSMPNPGIVVTRHGKPVKNVRVYMYSDDSHVGNAPRWSGLSNSDGIVAPSTLPDGRYHVSANSGSLEAALYIDVKKENEQGARFEMRLLRSDGVDSAEEMPVRVWIQDFQGVVQDPSGAVIPRTNIEVLRKRSVDDGDVADIESDEKGLFSAHLEAGTYIAVFRFRGFHTTMFPFEIGKEGWKALKLRMQIGGTTHGTLDVTELAEN